MPIKGRTLEELPRQSDARARGEERIAAVLGKLKDSWISDSEMIAECKLASTNMAHYRTVFATHVVELPRTKISQVKFAWAGTSAFAAKLRASLTK